jgi:hypothetical protein
MGPVEIFSLPQQTGNASSPLLGRCLGWEGASQSQEKDYEQKQEYSAANSFHQTTGPTGRNGITLIASNRKFWYVLPYQLSRPFSRPGSSLEPKKGKISLNRKFHIIFKKKQNNILII